MFTLHSWYKLLYLYHIDISSIFTSYSYHITWYSNISIFYCIIMYLIILCCVILHCTTLYYLILCFIRLHYIILHYMITVYHFTLYYMYELQVNIEPENDVLQYRNFIFQLFIFMFYVKLWVSIECSERESFFFWSCLLSTDRFVCRLLEVSIEPRSRKTQLSEEMWAKTSGTCEAQSDAF